MTTNPEIPEYGAQFDRELLKRQLASWAATSEPDVINFDPPKISLKGKLGGHLAYSEISTDFVWEDNPYESMIRSTQFAVNQIQERLIEKLKAKVDNQLADFNNWVLQITPLTSHSDYQIDDNNYTFFLEQEYRLRPKTDKEMKIKARAIDRCGFCHVPYAMHEKNDANHGFLFVEEWCE